MTRSNRATSLARARSAGVEFSRGDAVEGEVLPATTSSKGMAFAFGDPEPVLSRRELIDHIECWHNGRYYDPPVPLGALTRAKNVSPHHGSAIDFKLGQLVRDFIPHPLLDVTTFEGWALDYLVLANAYLERVDNMVGRPLALKRSLAKYTRRGLKDGEFFYKPNWRDEHVFAPGSVHQTMAPGLDQEIYGLPAYMSALQSAFLNENATLFRRRYYVNGAHSGFIMYVSEADLSNTDADAIEAAMKGTKGVGNFRNMFLHIPGGKKDGIQLLHPGEAAAKDEFLGIKNTTRDDILAAHRVPPQLLGVVPANAGGFGDVDKANVVFYENEMIPLQMRLRQVNDWIGQEVVRFRERNWPGSTAPTT